MNKEAILQWIDETQKRLDSIRWEIQREEPIPVRGFGDIHNLTRLEPGDPMVKIELEKQRQEAAWPERITKLEKLVDSLLQTFYNR